MSSQVKQICQEYLDEHLVDQLESSFKDSKIKVFHQAGRNFAVINLEPKDRPRRINKQDEIGYNGVYVFIDENETERSKDFVFTGNLSMNGDLRSGVRVFGWISFNDMVKQIKILNRLSFDAVLDDNL